jgi:hypothetical protein
MSEPTDIQIVLVWTATGTQVMLRIPGADGTDIKQADVTSIDRKVYDLSSTTPNTETDASIAADARVVSEIVYDILQTDARWDADSTGYNFRDQIEAAIVTDPHRFSVVYTFVPDTGENYKHVVEVHGQHDPGS